MLGCRTFRNYANGYKQTITIGWKKRLKATHISDYISRYEDHLLPFSGDTDWRKVVRSLKAIEYTGDFTYEVHRYTMRLPQELVLSALKHSVAVGNYLLRLE